MIASAASWFATDLVVVNVHLVTASFWLHRNHSHSWIRLLSNNLFLLFSEIVCEKSLSVQPSALDRMRLTLPTLTLDKLKGAAGEPWTPCPTAGRPPAEGRTLSRGAPSVSLARDFLGFAETSIIHLLHLRVRVPLVKVAKVFPPKIYFPLPDFSFSPFPLFLRPILCPNHCFWLDCLQEIGFLRPPYHNQQWFEVI